MPRNRPVPTPELQQQICAFIRAGGFPRVAAQAAGVRPDVFARWLRRGRGRRAPADYRAFAAAVDQAVAQARLAAELQVFEKRPLDWLKCGPAKETGADPGWSSTPKPAARSGAAGRGLMQQPEFLRLCRALLEALTPFPDARAAAADVLAVPGARPGAPQEGGT